MTFPNAYLSITVYASETQNKTSIILLCCGKISFIHTALQQKHYKKQVLCILFLLSMYLVFSLRLILCVLLLYACFCRLCGM